MAGACKCLAACQPSQGLSTVHCKHATRPPNEQARFSSPPLANCLPPPAPAFLAESEDVTTLLDDLKEKVVELQVSYLCPLGHANMAPRPAVEGAT